MTAKFGDEATRVLEVRDVVAAKCARLNVMNEHGRGLGE